MIEHQIKAHIINTASGAGLIAAGSGLQYATSKFAVVGLSEELRLELERFAIGVSVLCPGPVATSIIQTTLAFPGRPRIALTPEEIQMSDRTIAQLSPILPKA